MSETDFQALYKEYVEAENREGRQKCIEKLHQVIYTYPVNRFNAAADVAADFYMYYFDRIASLFEEYDNSVSFIVYLSVKLKFAYFRFLNRTQKELPQADWKDECSLSQNEAGPDVVRSYIKDALKELPGDEELRLRLYFGFRLYLSHFRDLLQRKKSLVVFKLYRDYLNQVELWMRRSTKEREELLYRLNVLQEQEKASFKTVSREKLLKRFFEVKPPVKLKTLAELLNESTSNVQRRIRNALEKVKTYLAEQLPYFKRLADAP